MSKTLIKKPCRGHFIVILKYSEEMLYFYVLVGFGLPSFAESICNFPPDLKGSWLESVYGNYELYTVNSSTFNFPANPMQRANIFCYEEANVMPESKGRTFLAGSSVIVQSGLSLKVWVCLYLEKARDGIFLIQHFTSKNHFTKTRLKLIFDTSKIPTINETCDDLTNSDYYLLVKKDMIKDLIVECPVSIRGMYTYNFTSKTCAITKKTADFCNTTSLLNFQETTCPKQIAYTDHSAVSCLHSMNRGDRHYLWTYDIQSKITTPFPFTCFVYERVGNILYMSQHAELCHSDQTATTAAGENGATFAGTLIACPFESSSRITTTADTGASTNTVSDTVIGAGSSLHTTDTRASTTTVSDTVIGAGSSLHPHINMLIVILLLRFLTSHF